MSQVAANVIDRGALRNLMVMVNDDAAFIDEMIDVFFADTPEQFAAIRTSLAAGDAYGVRRAAHTLKSNSANFGMTAVANLCRILEEHSGYNDLSDTADLLQQIEAAYEQARPALDAARPSGW